MSKKSKRISHKKQTNKKSKSKKASRKRPAKSSHSTKTWPIMVVVALVVFSSGYFYDKYSRVYPVEIKSITSAKLYTIRGGETRPTLAPALFVGEVARAYNVAKENRELLDSIYCYCNCKKSFGHKSLLTCFVDRHAVNCTICKDQALYAHSLFQKDNDISKVRVATDKKFWRPLR